VFFNNWCAIALLASCKVAHGVVHKGIGHWGYGCRRRPEERPGPSPGGREKAGDQAPGWRACWGACAVARCWRSLLLLW